MGIDYEKYFAGIGQRESSNNYQSNMTERNSNATAFALGRYQMISANLGDYGLLSITGQELRTKSQSPEMREKYNGMCSGHLVNGKVSAGTARSSYKHCMDTMVVKHEDVWKAGLSWQDFKENKNNIQDRLMRTYTDTQYKQLVKSGVINENSDSDTTHFYLATAHLGGVGGAKKAFKGEYVSDGLGTHTNTYGNTVLKYMKQGIETKVNTPFNKNMSDNILVDPLPNKDIATFKFSGDLTKDLSYFSGREPSRDTTRSKNLTYDQTVSYFGGDMDEVNRYYAFTARDRAKSKEDSRPTLSDTTRKLS